MPIDKTVASFAGAVSDIPDGATVMIGGFGGAGGMPHLLMLALRDHGARNLTIVSNTAGIAAPTGFGWPPGMTPVDHAVLIDNGQVAKVIASFPVSGSVSRPNAFETAFRAGKIVLEVVPQGTLAERMRAAGAGIPAFYTATSFGTPLAEGKEQREFAGRQYVMEEALHGDVALIEAWQADRWGNLTYRATGRNFNPVMAAAAKLTVVQTQHVVELGALDPEAIVTPGVLVDRVLHVPYGDPASF